MAATAIIDYGMGNLRSMARAVEHVGGRDVRVTNDADAIAGAERVIFPGQGAVRDCMAALAEHGLIDVLRTVMADRPFLGVCMGMQALLSRSEENEGVTALEVYPGSVRHLRRLTGGDKTLKIPHMGWNRVRQTRPHPLWADIDDGARFYFVHSYHVEPQRDELVLGTTEYGREFAAAIGRANVFATQFHPEKSSRVGLQLLSNFINWNGEP